MLQNNKNANSIMRNIYIVLTICFILEGLLIIGANIVSAMAPTLHERWGFTSLYIGAIWAVSVLAGTVGCIVLSLKTQLLDINVVAIISASICFAGQLGIFVSSMVEPATGIPIFILSYVIFGFGFYTLLVTIDCFMGDCSTFYNDCHPILPHHWVEINFALIGGLQVLSDTTGRFVSDVLTAILTKESFQEAMLIALGVAGSIIICIVLLLHFMRNVRTTVKQMTSDGKINTNWHEYDKFLKFSFTSNLSLNMLMLLNVLWVVNWDSMLVLMPDLWVKLFNLSATDSPMMIGGSLLISLGIGIICLRVRPTLLTLKMGGGLVLLTIAVAVLLIFDGTTDILVMTSLLSCGGILLSIISMAMVPFLFDTSRYQSVFASIAVAKTVAFVAMPPSYGLILVTTYGGYIMVGLFLLFILIGLGVFYGLLQIIAENQTSLTTRDTHVNSSASTEA